METPKLPPGVGPHEGRELDLLLSGAKPVARFHLDGLSTEYEGLFDEAVKRRKVLAFDFPATELHRHRRYYCIPGEEWRVKLMERIEAGELGEFTTEDLHRMDGALLGYERADIDAFIAHIRSVGKA